MGAGRGAGMEQQASTAPKPLSCTWQHYTGLLGSASDKYMAQLQIASLAGVLHRVR